MIEGLSQMRSADAETGAADLHECLSQQLARTQKDGQPRQPFAACGAYFYRFPAYECHYRRSYSGFKEIPAAELLVQKDLPLWQGNQGKVRFENF